MVGVVPSFWCPHGPILFQPCGRVILFFGSEASLDEPFLGFTQDRTWRRHVQTDEYFIQPDMNHAKQVCIVAVGDMLIMAWTIDLLIHA
jgi:hypothetical protein